jgi:hypothetical protein
MTMELPPVSAIHHLGMSSWRSRRFGIQAACTVTSPMQLLVEESMAFIAATVPVKRRELRIRRQTER